MNRPVEDADIVVFPDLEDALIGTAHDPGFGYAAIYSTAKIIRILMDRDGMDRQEALDWFYTNTVAWYAETGNPMFMDDLDN